MPHTQHLPPELIEACGGAPTRMGGFSDAITHIGHAIMEPEIGVLISAPAAVVCTGADSRNAYYALHRLEDHGLLETYTPEEITRPVAGRWLMGKTRFFKPTERGLALIPAVAPEDCGLRNPFARLTAREQRMGTCALCRLASADSFLVREIADCQKEREDAVSANFHKLHQEGLFARSLSPPTFLGGPRRRPFLYSLTSEGALYLTPTPAENCPTRLHPPPPKPPIPGLNTGQQEVIDPITQNVCRSSFRRQHATHPSSNDKKSIGRE